MFSQAVWTNTMSEVCFRMSTHIIFNSDPAPDFGPDLLTVRAHRQKSTKRFDLTQRSLQLLIGRFQASDCTAPLSFKECNQPRHGAERNSPEYTANGKV
jgi:hypothetical protein